MIETYDNTKKGGKIKGFFGKIFTPIKKFFANLKIILKVQKGALIKFLATVLLPVLVGMIGTVAFPFATVSAIMITFWVIFAVFTLSILVWARHDYKLAVKEAAKVEVAKANKKGYKHRKAAEKKSIKSQNKHAEANTIESKYNK